MFENAFETLFSKLVEWNPLHLPLERWSTNFSLVIDSVFCIILKCITSVWMSNCHRNSPYLNNCLKSVPVHVNLPLTTYNLPLTTKSQSSLFSISVHGCLIASQNLNFCFCSFEIPGESKYSRMSQNERFHRSNKNMPALSLFFSSQFLFSFSFTFLASDVLDDS